MNAGLHLQEAGNAINFLVILPWMSGSNIKSPLDHPKISKKSSSVPLNLIAAYLENI